MRSILLALVILVALVGCGRVRKEQVFTGVDRSDYAKDRYECMAKHGDVDNFIACMGSKGYKHTGEQK